MVVTCWSATEEIGVMQERVAWPSICTVQAPHCATPQPNLVPCRPTTSRIAQSRGMSGSASRVVGLPLSVNEIAIRKLRSGLRLTRVGVRHIHGVDHVVTDCPN